MKPMPFSQENIEKAVNSLTQSVNPNLEKNKFEDISDFVSHYVSETLNEEKMADFSEENANLMQGYIKNIEEFAGIYREVFWREIPLFDIEKMLPFVESKEEFEEKIKLFREVGGRTIFIMCPWILGYSTKKIAKFLNEIEKYFFYQPSAEIMKFIAQQFSINTLKKLKKLLQGDYWFLMSDRYYERLVYLCEHFSFHTTDELEKLLKNELFQCQEKGELEKIIKKFSISSWQNFIEISEMDIIYFSHESYFESLCQRFGVHTIQDLKILNNSMSGYVSHTNIQSDMHEKLFFLLDVLDIQTLKDCTRLDLYGESFDRWLFWKQGEIHKIKNHPLGEKFGFFLELTYLGQDTKSFDFPIDTDNFLDFVEDENMPIFHFDKYGNIEFSGSQSWTKKWFLENPERKKYIQKENIGFFQALGTVEGCKKFDDPVEVISLGDAVSQKIQKYFGKDFTADEYTRLLSNQDVQFESILNFQFLEKITHLSFRGISLLYGYIKEKGISLRYFLEDMEKVFRGNHIASIDLQTLNNLLKNNIYPTRNILQFLTKENSTIEKLVEIRENYKKHKKFDVKNPLHKDLEYIEFRYMIDNSTKKSSEIGRGYYDFLGFINEPYSVDSVHERHYQQAGYEAFIAKTFIDKITENSPHTNIFSNMSYGKVVSGAFKNELKESKKINFRPVRIGSTECHGEIHLIKQDLFSKADIKNLFKGETIILDGTGNSSFPNSNIGFKTYFFVLNQVLADIHNDKNLLKNYEISFQESVQKDKGYLPLYSYLKGIITRNHLYKSARKFDFCYASQNKYASLREGGNLMQIQDEKTDKNAVKVYYGDFVERKPKYDRERFRAYFDDTHITNFAVIPTKTGFNYVDVNFEEKLRQHYKFFKVKYKASKNLIPFYIFQESNK